MRDRRGLRPRRRMAKTALGRGPSAVLPCVWGESKDSGHVATRLKSEVPRPSMRLWWRAGFALREQD